MLLLAKGNGRETLLKLCHVLLLISGHSIAFGVDNEDVRFFFTFKPPSMKDYNIIT
jgi:hypothetical protein